MFLFIFYVNARRVSINLCALRVHDGPNLNALVHDQFDAEEMLGEDHLLALEELTKWLVFMEDHHISKVKVFCESLVL